MVLVLLTKLTQEIISQLNLITMEIKLMIKIGFLFMFFLINNDPLIAQANLDVLTIDSIYINEFKIDNDIKNCFRIFGKPEKYKELEIEDGDGPDGWSKIYYIDYKALSIRYIDYYGETLVSSITVLGKEYIVHLGNIKINIGDNINVITEKFSTSSKNYYDRKKQLNNTNELEFYIKLLIEKNNYKYYGLINISVKENVINKISFKLDQGT